MIGVNKFSTITVECKAFKAPVAMAMENVLVQHQPYMNLPAAKQIEDEGVYP